MSLIESEFDAWAEFYDLIHPGLPGEESFYVQRGSHAGQRILELGCGTGRITLPLARKGCDVTGLDMSRGMLDVCAEKWGDEGNLSGALTLVHGDMSQFQFEEQFDAIVIAYRTFMHLHTQKQQLKCLECIRKHLTNDGIVLMNTWNPKAAYIHAYDDKNSDNEYNLVEVYSPLNSGTAIQHFHRVQCDPILQRMHEEHLLITFDEDDHEMDRVVLPMSRVWTTVRELRLLFSLSGLEVVSLFGGFDSTPFTRDSEESIWVLKRGDKP